MKKGKGSEVQAAAKLAILLGVQLFDCEEVFLKINLLPP